MDNLNPSNREVARLLLKTLDGNENPTDEQIDGAVNELRDSLDVMAALTLPLTVSLGFGSEPQRAHTIGTVLLAYALCEELSRANPTGPTPVETIGAVLQLAHPLFEVVKAQIEAEKNNPTPPDAEVGDLS